MSEQAVTVAPSNVKALIYNIRKMPRQEAMLFEKKRMIAMAVTDLLRSTGTLYTTPERRGYFFDTETRTLLALDEETFAHHLADLTGLNPTEMEFRYVMEHLRTETYQRGHRTQVYRLAHYNQVAQRIYVTDFSSGMWVLDGRSVVHAPNGESGVLFATPLLASPYAYLSSEKRSNGSTLRAFLEPIRFDSTAGLSPDEWRDLLFVWVLSLFFPELHPTKLIPTFIGSHGSTKTTTARRLGMQLLGERFNVGSIETGDRGEQAFVATVCGKPFAVFDNADAPVRWLPDRLATFATGHEFELRELYTTNQLVVYKPSAQLVLTSRDPHFRRPDVAERLFICRLVRPERFIPESVIFAQTLENRDAVWSDLLDLLNQTLIALQGVPVAPLLNYRMADFASFGWRLSHARGGSEASERFCQSLAHLETEQARYTTEEDPVAACLTAWLSAPMNLNREIETGELYVELIEIARKQGLLLPKTSASLGKRLHSARRALELDLGVKIGVKSTTHTSSWVFSTATESPLPTHPAPLWTTSNGGQEAQDGQERETL